MSTDAIPGPLGPEPSCLQTGHRSVEVLELLAVVPLIGWIVFAVWRDPATFANAGLLEWIVAIALVDLLPVPTTVGLPFSLSFPLQLSVALIYPQLAISGAVVFLGSSDVRELRRGVSVGRALWNRAQIAWSVVVEAAIFHSIASLESDWFVLIPAVLLSGIVGYAVNAALVAVHVRLERGEAVTAVLRQMHVGVFGEFLLSYMGLALFSVVMASTFVSVGHWSILVFMAPLMFARQMFTRTHRLHEATVELEEREREKEYQALHDALTGLPNRVMFHRHVSDALEAADDRVDQDRVLALMLLDLDHFKEVNDTLGHHVGDILLQQIGPRLSGVLREGDLMARLGGDEFGIALPDLPDEATAIRVAERIMEELERPLTVEGVHLDVSGSIGVALGHARDVDVETLMRRADVAMYAAKEAGCGFEIYSPSLDRHSAAGLTLIGRVRPAIDDHEFVLWYQPKVRLSDERVIGVEALIRWMHPERGLVLPAEFIPMVERTVLLRPLTQHVLDLALQQLRRWRHMGLDLEMAVNVSPRSLLDRRLVEEVSGTLARWRVPAERLTLELTESFIMSESARSTEVLTGLSETGVLLSIDDFGTGFSSLSHLRRLPIEEIKIDRSFVGRMREDENDEKLVRATVDLGRNLGLRVVAEGVEDRETGEALAGMGCDAAQGFLFAEPRSAPELTRWLAGRLPAASDQPVGPSARRDPQGMGHLRVV